jgi:hypothetical protein
MVILLNDRLGLVDRDLEVAELEGVINSELVDTIVGTMGSRWGTGFPGFAVSLDDLLSIGFSAGDVPRSPELGSKTLSTTGSVTGPGVLEVDILGESDRSNMRLLEPCSATNVASNLWLSGESGSKVKSSRRISTISK